jgi:hypothetical protein
MLILVELDNGHVHQVLASKEQKEICMALLRSDEGSIRLSDRVEPVMLEKFSEANAEAHTQKGRERGPENTQD